MRAMLLVGPVLVAGLAVPAGAHLNHVTATPQVSPDGTVYVESALVVDAAWLVLHADDGGAAGRPIGHAFYDPGSGTGVSGTGFDIAVAAVSLLGLLLAARYRDR